MANKTDVLEGWTKTRFTHDAIAHDVHRRGSGPGVIVMHEIPGITPPVARFANRVADAGFTVLLPHMFGEIGRPMNRTYAFAQIARACVSREFSVLAARGSSPITDWLRALARDLHAELGGPGVGAVGMCLTGNFALAMSARRAGLHVSDEALVAIQSVDAAMMAPVLSQPSLPAGITCALSGMPCALPAAESISMASNALPSASFKWAKRAAGTAGSFVKRKPSTRRLAFAHRSSVLTEALVDREGHPTKAALDRVLAFFAERLHGVSQKPA